MLLKLQNKIRGDYDKYIDDTKDYYEVEVLAYVHGSYSKKEQKYYLTEVSHIITDIDAGTVNLLYTGN